MIHLKHMALAATAVTFLSSLCACVERRITIGSDPAGALVQVNGVEVGRTPVSVPFTWYGDYDLRFRGEKNVGTPEKPDIRRYYLHTHKKTDVPWFETIGVDLFAELSPAQFKDEKIWAFELPEVVEPTDQEHVKRANELKTELGKEGPRPR